MKNQDSVPTPKSTSPMEMFSNENFLDEPRTQIVKESTETSSKDPRSLKMSGKEVQ